MTWFWILGAALFVSILGNSYLFYLLKRSKKEPVPTFDVKNLLHELSQGPAIVKIQVIDKESIFLRAPN